VAVAKDKFVLAPRYDGWFAPLVVIPGREVASAQLAAGKVIATRRDNAKVVVDVGGGWGADCYGHLLSNGIDSFAYMGVKATNQKLGQFTFTNVRTAALWSFREALDPSKPGGSAIALPPSNTLRADLCAPQYEVRRKGDGMVVVAESKEDVRARLGRSPDEGDAVVMAWYTGTKQHNISEGWGKRNTPPVVNRGRRYT